MPETHNDAGRVREGPDRSGPICKPLTCTFMRCPRGSQTRPAQGCTPDVSRSTLGLRNTTRLTISGRYLLGTGWRCNADLHLCPVSTSIPRGVNVSTRAPSGIGQHSDTPCGAQAPNCCSRSDRRLACRHARFLTVENASIVALIRVFPACTSAPAQPCSLRSGTSGNTCWHRVCQQLAKTRTGFSGSP
jgi:hypothetical protein